MLFSAKFYQDCQPEPVEGGSTRFVFLKSVQFFESNVGLSHPSFIEIDVFNPTSTSSA